MDYPEDTLSGTALGLNLLNRVAFARKQKAARVTWHTHEYYELILALDGATVYEFPDGQTVDFTGGHYLVISPGLAHRGLQDVRRPTSIVGLMLDPNSPRATGGSPFDKADLAWLFEQFATARRHAYPMNGELKGLAKTVARNMSDAAPATSAELTKLRWAVCGIVLEAARQLATVRSDVQDQTVERAIEFMHAHVSTPCPIEQVAKRLGCSRAKLFDVFKESTGMTPYDYWLRLRIDHAQHMLLESIRPIADIALDCGFSTTQYFSLVFRKYAGMNPNEYRERFQLSEDAIRA
jgi:AraC-like DNA-binding protein